jgi:hypothetical protein
LTSESKSGYGPAFYVVSAIVVGVSALETFALFKWGNGPWADKLSAFLAVVGLYGTALGFLAKSEAMAELKQNFVELMDPNPLTYLSGNMWYCVIVAQLGAQGSKTRMVPGTPKALWFIGLFLWLPVGILMILYVLLHTLIIAPLAYLPMAVASSITAKIKYAAGDFEVSLGEKKASIKSIVSADPVAAKGFVVGVPALSMSILTQALKLIT